MTVYRSKIGLEILLPIAVILGVTFYLHIIHTVWVGLIINSLVLIFIIYLYVNTSYVIDDKKLVVKAGFLFNQTILVEEIKCVSRTKNPLSSPALSLDRIQLSYGNSKSIIVSPKNKNAFVDHLQQINPNIKYINRS